MKIVKENKKKKCLILANGNKPSKYWINYFIRTGYSFVICADGGADSAKQLGIQPKIIIGDLDSISAKTLKHYENTAQIIKYKRQNDTDLEKSIKFAIKNGFEEVVLCGATGNRLDHTFGNLGVVLKFNDKIKIFLHHHKSILYAIKGSNIIPTHEGETISFYGIDNKTKFISKGLKYPLRNVSLPFGISESTSNVAKTKNITIKISGGTGFVIRDLETVKKYDLIFHA